jgi:uncharacterized protein (TIGR00730 family)
MITLKNICVYCGSSSGVAKEYQQAAHDLGSILAQRNIGLIYGGGRVGLMGTLADAVLKSGGRVTGIIPQHLLDLELGHSGITSLVPVSTMHTRKHAMAEQADAFIALPGGIGTAEEVLEILTWLQLGLHVKPVALLNVLDYYRKLLDFLDHMTGEGFLLPEHRRLLIVESEIPRLLSRLEQFEPGNMTAKIKDAAFVADRDR